jgi:hypothetical protein
MSQHVPFGLRPIRTYETKYLYTGLGRYDTEAKKLSNIQISLEGKILYNERDYSGSLSKSYYTELVRVTIYSESPRMWSEELAPNKLHFFQQIPQQEVT